MSTVTKPVMLDETGKQIKGTLEEIRDAITGSGSTHYPVSIRISTPPEKVDYIVGEQLDLTGIAVQAIYDNGVPYDVTGDTTFSPSDGTVLTASDTAITATWTWTLGQQTQTFTATRAINVSTVESIEITTPPTKVDYTSGETLDLTGIVVKANMSNNTQINVTSQCTFSPDDGDTVSATDTAITATLTVSGSTFTDSTPIYVVAVYGAEWDGSASSAWTRTDAAASFVDPVPQKKDGSGWTTGSSPFDSIMPWSGMEIVTDSNAGKVVKIPKFYYKWTRTGSAMKLQIASSQFAGSLVSPAHADRGDGYGERDNVYVGRYACASDYKSKTGVKPLGDKTRAQFRTSIHALGSNIWQWDFATWWTINMLYLVEFADWNSQAKIGIGGSNNHAIDNTGQTDSMTYHTGTNQAAYSTDGHIQYRYIEDLWANVITWCDGMRFEGTNIYGIRNPAEFADTSVGTLIGTRPGAFGSGIIKSWSDPSSIQGFEYALYPNSYENGNSGYCCDQYIAGYQQSDPGQVLCTGNGYSSSWAAGLFRLDDEYPANTALGSVGSRLMMLPDNS